MAWIDLHTDVLWNMTKVGEDPLVACRELQCDLPRMLSAGVRAAVWAIFIEPEEEGPAERSAALERVAMARELVSRSDGRLLEVRTRGDLRRVLAPQEPPPSGLILAIEGLHPLCGSLEWMEEFCGLGVRLVTLTWNQGNSFGTGCRNPRAGEAGLSALGRRLVGKLGEWGVILDLAHSGPRTLRDALDQASGPVTVSHTACSALRPHPRNLSDEELRLVGARGGLVGITIYPGFLCEDDKPATAKNFADHVLHAAGVIGLDHVALGTDLDGITRLPADMRGVEDLPVLADELRRRGLSEAEVAKVAFENARTFLESSLPEA